MIADWVWYVCPVPAAARIIENRFDHPEVANSPLVFPPAGATGPAARFMEYRVFEGDDDAAAWASIFGAIPAGL
jgi:spermidine/putrescine transport system substrate-binding protein